MHRPPQLRRVPAACCHSMLHTCAQHHMAAVLTPVKPLLNAAPPPPLPPHTQLTACAMCKTSCASWPPHPAHHEHCYEGATSSPSPKPIYTSAACDMHNMHDLKRWCGNAYTPPPAHLQHRLLCQQQAVLGPPQLHQRACVLCHHRSVVYCAHTHGAGEHAAAPWGTRVPMRAGRSNLAGKAKVLVVWMGGLSRMCARERIYT